MPEPVYLWSENRRRRHIAVDPPEHARILYGGQAEPPWKALCGQYHYTREATTARLARWNAGPVLDKWVNKLDTVPACSRCAKAAAKLETAGS